MRHVAFSFLASWAFVGMSFAQFETAVVLGTVRDPGNNAVPGANVTLFNTETGIQAATATNESGDYLFLNVKIGNYNSTCVEYKTSTYCVECK